MFQISSKLLSIQIIFKLSKNYITIYSLQSDLFDKYIYGMYLSIDQKVVKVPLKVCIYLGVIALPSHTEEVSLSLQCIYTKIVPAFFNALKDFLLIINT